MIKKLPYGTFPKGNDSGTHARGNPVIIPAD